MVERRLHILITSWRPDDRAASAFFSRKPSTNGPFQIERAIARFLSLLPRVPARHDELAGGLVLAGLLALGREAPRRDWVPAARGAALAAAMRMVDRVHRHAAIVRAATEPAGAPGLADRDVHVIRVRDGAHSRHAATVHEALLAGIEPQDDVILVTSDDLRVSARRAGELTAFADLELDV